jgi:polysaccharide deacetylase 2 family uncharacterized protein YibQ
VLNDQLPPDELRRRVVADLARFDGYVGVNNHMGSKFTENAAGMQIVMEELHKRGLLFIDSMTTGKSVGLAAARQLGVPAASRDIFIDDADDDGQIASQLARAEAQARRSGVAIAIGHPRDRTIAALSQWLPTLADKGITLVPVTQVVRTPGRSPCRILPICSVLPWLRWGWHCRRGRIWSIWCRGRSARDRWPG